MRDELLEEMEALRASPERGVPSAEFQYQALKVSTPLRYTLELSK